MLAIEVEYLLGRAFASDFRDREESEWPPHPDRLFSALIAAHHDTFGTDTERAALAWFQRLDPPEVSAGQAGEGSAVVTFVPTNYAGASGSTHPEQRGKQPRVFPMQGPSSPVVHFIWPNAEPDEAVRSALVGLAARVSSLGRACSLVRMTLSDSPQQPNMAPDESGDQVLRVFGDRRMEELEALFKAGHRPQPGPQKRYRNIIGANREPIAKSCFGEMVVLRKDKGASLPIEAALTLTTATRKALLDLAVENGLDCDMLNGHGRHPHCAFVALPFAGFKDAEGEPRGDGRLLGVGILLPRSISLQDRRRVLQVSAQLQKINLRDALSLWEVSLAGFDVVSKTLQPATWTRPSSCWSTITPILLDRFPKKDLTVEDILAAACERIGLPAPLEITHQPYSKLSGVPPVPAFRLLRDKNEKPRWGVHATLRFASVVQGPVTLGAGRYFGLGLMKPIKGDRDDG